MLCRFYQRGSCKFGDSCRYVHEDYDEDRYHNFYSPQNMHNTKGSNLYNQLRDIHYHDHRNYQLSDSRTNQRPTSNSNVKLDHRNDSTIEGPTPNAISIPEQHMMVVISDMEEWSNCSMWKLSCYGFLKNGKCLAGLEEFSFEEIRYACYQARLTNKYGSYLSWLHGVLQKNSMFRNQFINLDTRQKESLLSSIEKFIKKTEEEEKAQLSTGFPVHRPISVFGAPTQNSHQSSIFQQDASPSNVPTQLTNIFQQAANVFPHNFQQNLFQQHLQQSPYPVQNNLQEVQQTLEHNVQPQKLQQNQSNSLALGSNIGSSGGSSLNQKGNIPADLNIYSDAKTLSNEDIKEFQANSFNYIPIAAPPMEFV